MSELLPVIDEPWDAERAAESMRKRASKDGSASKDSIDWKKYAEGFFYHDTNNGEDYSSFKLPFAVAKEGRLYAVKNAISAVKGTVNDARGGLDIPEEDQKKVMKKVEQYEKKIEKDSKKELESMLRFAIQTDQSELLNKLLDSTKVLVSKTAEFQAGLFELNDQLNEAKTAGIDITDVSLLLDNITDLLGSTYDSLKSVVDELSSGETGRAFLLAP